MDLTLKRDIIGNEFTLGELFIDGEPFCFTCEDKVRPHKIKGETAIPYGGYEIKLTWSNRFQKILPILLNVPEFEGVRIHSGNTIEDTEGCILVGMERNAAGGYITRSKEAMAALMPVLKKAIDDGEGIWLEIV